MNKHLTRRFMEEQNGDGGVGDGVPPAVPAAGNAPPPAAAWYDDFKDPAVKDWLKSYGEAYPNPEAVANKALNLEKFVGAEKAGRGVIAPKPDAKPEEWQAFYKKVGSVPEDPNGYKVPTDLAPEIAAQLADDPMMKAFREHAHTIGMPPMFFESAVKWYIDQNAGGEEAMIADFTRKSEADLMSLKTEWPGVEYDKNVELGRRAAREFIPHENDDEFTEKMSRIEGALGTKETMKLFASIGGSIGEAGFVSGDGNGNVGGVMTPEAARVRIDSLKKDPAFAAKLLNNDADARAEWDRLHKTAYSK